MLGIPIAIWGPAHLVGHQRGTFPVWSCSIFIRKKLFTVPKWLRLLHVLFSLGCEKVVTRDIELLKRFGYPDWFVKAWRAGGNLRCQLGLDGPPQPTGDHADSRAPGCALEDKSGARLSAEKWTKVWPGWCDPARHPFEAWSLERVEAVWKTLIALYERHGVHSWPTKKWLVPDKGDLPLSNVMGIDVILFD